MLYLFSRAKRVAYSIESRLSRKDKYMGRGASGRLKSAYSATENSHNIEKNRVASCAACILCLFLTVLWVCLESAIVVFSSYTHFMTTILSS